MWLCVNVHVAMDTHAALVCAMVQNMVMRHGQRKEFGYALQAGSKSLGISFRPARRFIDCSAESQLTSLNNLYLFKE
jgi:hypothetical protein